MPIAVNAQFNTLGTIGRTQNFGPDITGIGIGFFPTVPSLNARLHVNNFLLGAPNGPLNGFLFRTDGNHNIVNQWQLYTGPTNATTTEKFKLYVPANANDVVLQQSQPGGVMGINTGGAITRIIVADGGVGNNDGRVALGNNLPLTFVPTARLHLHQTAGVNSMRYTTNATGTTATDGLEIGINATQNAVITQHEGADMIFRVFDFNTVSNTNAAVEKMRLTSGGTMATDAFGNYDGLRIWSPINNPAPNPVGFLDLWVSGGNQTHIRWDGSGIIQGIRNRFEVIGNRDGLYFEARRVTAGNNPNIVFYINNTNGPAVLPTAAPTPLPTFVGGFIWDGDVNAAFDGNFGVNTPTPQNRVEITGNASNPYFGNPAGQSGLRLTNMTSNGVPGPNPGLGVLAVDNDGDVIYVPDLGGIGNCNAPTLLAATGGAINFNNQNMYWQGNGSGVTTDNSMLIGLPCGSVPRAKLDILQASASAGTGSLAVYVENTDFSGNTFITSAVGVKSVLPNTNDFRRVAGWFESPQTPGVSSCAIFVPQLGGNVSIGYPDYFGNTGGLLEVNGNIFMNGVLVSTSDQAYKTNVTPIHNALAKVMSLSGVYFYWDTISYPNNNFSSRKQVGFIAQNVDTVLPEVVYTDANGNKSISYERIIALYAQALKELNAKVDSLSQMNNARISNTSHVHNTDVTLTNPTSIVLNQNVPNPFAEQTVIGYNLPETVKRAQILFYDAQGKLIQTVELTARGAGQLTVFADDLSSGVYTYALVADGAVVDTKKMVKQ